MSEHIWHDWKVVARNAQDLPVLWKCNGCDASFGYNNASGKWDYLGEKMNKPPLSPPVKKI